MVLLASTNNCGKLLAPAAATFLITPPAATTNALSDDEPVCKPVNESVLDDVVLILVAAVKEPPS